MGGFRAFLPAYRQSCYGTKLAGALGDPYFNNVTALLLLNGTNGDTSITDSTGGVWTPNSTTPISNTQSKFGGTSLYFDGTTTGFSRASNTGFGFGTGDFVVEGFVYPLDTTAVRAVMDMRPSDIVTPFWFGRSAAGELRIYDGTTTHTGGSIPANSWSHIAYERVGNSHTGYVNGVSVISFINSANYDSSLPCRLGCNVNGTSDKWFGYMDCLRVTKGVSRYGAAFTPPNTEFPNV